MPIISALPMPQQPLASFSLNFGKEFLDTFIEAVHRCADRTSPTAKNVSQKNYYSDEEKNGD
jgi:hypothetical protein